MVEVAISSIVGHVRSTCYKLHGYPADWKGKRRTTNGLIPKANLARAATGNNQLMQYSYQQLLNMLDQENEKTKAKANCDNMLASGLLPAETGGAIAPVDTNSVEGLSVDAQPAQVVSPVVKEVLAEPPNSSGVVPSIVSTGNSLKRSTRTIRPHIWLYDFHTSKPASSCLYPLSNHISYANLLLHMVLL
ncbi:hypothetical protein H5410_016585 [Solanum commersonii]|uniref:Integrase core domain containing protein n=1 Tax=Solanum commersonii TaxID=4109 RepID=A0A9J5ZWW2_SOLCO|nr:hypothetical protein H5410_016585 [Solanum commersonii]